MTLTELILERAKIHDQIQRIKVKGEYPSFKLLKQQSTLDLMICEERLRMSVESSRCPHCGRI